MGEEVDISDLPEPEPELEFHFAPVQLTPHAVDVASQVVPEQYWRPAGLYTWLQRRADEAFQKARVGEQEVILGRLKYVFGRDGDTPLLTTVILK